MRSGLDADARASRILRRMLDDCDELCATGDALLAPQYRHLRGRIAALLELTTPLGETEPIA